ncbi:hypothetical protein OS493_003706 [Desmophyllum pertusum]|uniref:Uncharacterized protein n=1 Tax=Desmophyllum pertusum TaxID=174260 RepID=A0A9X0DCT1_9CNID|nr:hypothetical protein OS493_003706 [Desmophyllum pertusum]
MLPAWFKMMVSADRSKPLTKTERFTQLTSLAYVLVGISMLLAPSLWRSLWNVELVGRTAGYMQLGGLVLAVEGYLLVIASRSAHKVPGHGHINITALTRLVLVNMSLLKMFQGGVAPRRYLAFFAVLDNSLAAGMFLVWIYTEEGASLVLFFKEIGSLIFRFPRGPWSSIAILVAGIAQFQGGLYLKDVDRLRSALNLDPFQGYSNIFLGFYFSLNVAHAVLYVSNSQAISRPFNISCVFYRVAINVPVICVLAVANQVETSLAVFLVCVEVSFAAFILVFLCCDKDEENKSK